MQNQGIAQDLELAQAYNVTLLSMMHAFKAILDSGVAESMNMTQLQLQVSGQNHNGTELVLYRLI